MLFAKISTQLLCFVPSVARITYTVLVETLNHAQSINTQLLISKISSITFILNE